MPHFNYLISIQYNDISNQITITKALQIPELTYKDAGHGDYIIYYNPNEYVGIVNIGMSSNKALVML